MILVNTTTYCKAFLASANATSWACEGILVSRPSSLWDQVNRELNPVSSTLDAVYQALKYIDPP